MKFLVTGLSLVDKTLNFCFINIRHSSRNPHLILQHGFLKLPSTLPRLLLHLPLRFAAPRSLLGLLGTIPHGYQRVLQDHFFVFAEELEEVEGGAIIPKLPRSLRTLQAAHILSSGALGFCVIQRVISSDIIYEVVLELLRRNCRELGLGSGMILPQSAPTLSLYIM